MAEKLIQPVQLAFRGLDADHGVMDAMDFGRSIQGTARFYNSIMLFWFEGRIPKRIVTPNIRIQVGPPQSGSLMYLIYVLMTHGTMALHPKLLWDLAEIVVPEFVKAIFARKSGRSTELEKALDIIHDLAAQHDDFAMTVHQDHMKDKRMLFSLVKELTSTNTKALSDMAQPIGQTAARLTHFDGRRGSESTIDEATADALRSPEDVIVGDQLSYRGKILGVDKTTGACRFEPEGQSKDLRGKITDPVLSQPGNIYTHALDSAIDVEVTAKPVMKDGEIRTLYISDAKEIEH